MFIFRIVMLNKYRETSKQTTNKLILVDNWLR